MIQFGTVIYSDIFDKDAVRYYRDHPIEFVEDIIFDEQAKANGGQYELTWQQKEILIAVANNKRTTIRSGRGIGKSSCLAFLVIWWLCVNEFPKVICTAPSYPNLKSVLWPEVAKWLRISLVRDIFIHTSERLYLKEDPTNWFCEPRTAAKPESMQGLHADNLLLLLDEASGIDREIYELLLGSLSGANNKIVLTGNPTRTDGFFFDSHHKYKSRWCRLNFSSLESPIVDPELIDYFRTQFGEQHDLYKVHILGEFPSGNPDAFIRYEDVAAAVYRSVEPEGEVTVGVDVARMGDDLTVVCYRQGYHIYPLITKAKTTIPEVSALVLDTIKMIRATLNYSATIKVMVDDTGLGGGVTDTLKLDRLNNIDVIPCNFGGAGNEEYENEASIMWGNVKSLINLIDLPDDIYLTGELSARRWEVSQRGRIWLEPKKRYKKEFGKSPDRADALVLCFARKTNVRVVLKGFDPLDGSIVKDFKTQYMSSVYMDSNRYGSVYMTRELIFAVVWATYHSDILYVSGEYYGDMTVQEISAMIKSQGPYKKILGNDLMFSKHGDDVGRQFKKMNINIRENDRYDEYGAIQMLERIIIEKRLVISKDCKHTIEQMATWKLDVPRKDAEAGYGLCYATIQVVSELRNKMGAQPFVPTIQSYSPERLIFQQLKDLGGRTKFRDNAKFMSV